MEVLRQNALNSRELAIVVWLGVLLIWGLTRSEIRASLKAVVISAAHLKILGPILGLVGYVACLCVVTEGVGLWSTSLIKETILWFVISGLVLFGNFTKVMQGRRLVTRKALLALVGTVLVEFYMNWFVMAIWAELILQPFVALLAMTLVVAEQKPEFESARRVLNALLGTVGLAIAAFVAIQLFSKWEEIDKARSLREFALPLWLTISVTPVVYLVAVLAAYEVAFLRIDFTKEEAGNRKRAKIALWTTFFVRIQPIGAFGGRWATEAVSADSLREARGVIRAYRDNHLS